MCNLYHVSPKDEFELYMRMHAADWVVPDYAMSTVGPAQPGMFFRPYEGRVIGQVGRWGLILPNLPRDEVDKPKYLTNNARFETIATKPTFRGAWKRGQRCLIPARWLQEPNWETGKNIWWKLRRADGMPWMVAGIWSEWIDRDTGEVLPSYAMVTINVDSHPLLRRLHKPERDKVTGDVLPPELQDKRGEAHIEPADWGTWLYGTQEEASRLLVPPPVEFFDQSDAIATDQLRGAIAAGDQRPAPPQLF